MGKECLKFLILSYILIKEISQVEDSMENLELVVRERNRAYWLLEVGEIEERPIKPVTDSFGKTSYNKGFCMLAPLPFYNFSFYL